MLRGGTYRLGRDQLLRQPLAKAGYRTERAELLYVWQFDLQLLHDALDQEIAEVDTAD